MWLYKSLSWFGSLLIHRSSYVVPPIISDREDNKHRSCQNFSRKLNPVLLKAFELFPAFLPRDLDSRGVVLRMVWSKPWYCTMVCFGMILEHSGSHHAPKRSFPIIPLFVWVNRYLAYLKLSHAHSDPLLLLNF